MEEEIRFKNQLINNIMATTKSIKHNTTNLPQVAEDFNSNVNVDNKYEQQNLCLPKKPVLKSARFEAILYDLDL